jgi:SAM-dependent methyltransferase
MMGFDVVALEPGGLGFEQNRSASMAFASSCDVQINHVAASAETADFGTIGKFDLVVSNNVLEHIPDVDNALTNLNNAINPSGVMIHSCPNYTFPFEPHFGIPLLPFMPRLTRLLLPKSVEKSGLWNSLNFITQSQVKRNARVNGMTCLFRAETMSKSIKRLNRDPQFAERHQTIARLVKIRFVYALLVRVFSLPPRFATPMDFIVCAPEQRESSNVRIWMKSR